MNGARLGAAATADGPLAMDGIILDFDNTICIGDEFYRRDYLGAVEEAVVGACGEWGRQMLHWHRRRTSHAGVLALGFFGVPFSDFAERLDRCSLERLPARTGLGEALRRLPCPAVLFSGSPRAFIERVLRHWRIEPDCFEQIVAWSPGEGVPVKHSCSPLTFRALAEQQGWEPRRCWSIGDSWESDLRPALAAGMSVIGVGPAAVAGQPWFATVEEALEHLCSSRAEGGAP